MAGWLRPTMQVDLKLIKKFNKDGVVINTSKERSIDDTPEIQGDGQSTDVLDKTAMAAAKRMK